jgi:hypothetical protein
VSAETALLAATALHAGFQLTVTVLVYPVLAATPPRAFARSHTLHSRRIVPVVGLVYVVLAASCLWLLVAGPRTPATLAACALSAVAAGVTTLVAAPTHGRLGTHGPRPSLLRQLVRSDRLRCVAAVAALVAAVVAVV